MGSCCAIRYLSHLLGESWQLPEHDAAKGCVVRNFSKKGPQPLSWQLHLCQPLDNHVAMFRGSSGR